MPDRVVRFILTGDSNGAVRAMRETETAASRTGRQLEKTGRDAKSGFALADTAAAKTHHAMKFLAGATGLGSVVFGVHAAIKAGQEWQQQQAQLQNALQATGQGGATNMRLLNDEIDRSTTRGGFLPAEQAQGLATFVRLTGNATKAVQLNREAVNFARGAHIDYTTAVQRVAQIQTGNVGRLQRYLGVIQPVTYYTASLTAQQKKQNPELYKHAQLLDRQATAAKANLIVQQRFGGATAAYSHTAAGAVSNAQHAFALLSEQIGKILLPLVAKAAQWLTKLAQNLIKGWPQTRKEIQEVVGWLKRHKDLVIALVAGLGTFVLGMKAVTLAMKAWAVIQAIINFELAANPVGVVVMAIAALVAAVVYCYMHFKTFRDIVNSVFQWFVGAIKTVVGFFKAHWQLLVLAIAGPLAPLILIITHLKTVLSIAKKIIGLPGKAIHAAGHFLSSLNPFHNGGLVHAFAPGGLVPGVGNTDSISARLTPGEFVLRKQVVGAVGASNLQALNNTGSFPGAGGAITIEPGTVVVQMGPRQVAEAVVHYQLKMGARR